eukprot:3054575-Pyramimonas_sp.AAC.1
MELSLRPGAGARPKGRYSHRPCSCLAGQKKPRRLASAVDTRQLKKQSCKSMTNMKEPDCSMDTAWSTVPYDTDT